MLKKLFGLGKEAEIEEEVVIAPLQGKVLPLEDVPDPTFAQKMMGDGLAIEPTEGRVTSPVEGEIVQLFPTKHAIGIRTKHGVEILIHIGLETVSMNGEGFEAHIKQGDKVKVGDALVDFSIDLVKEKAASTITPIIITNFDQLETFEKENVSEAIRAETALLKVKLKG